MNYYPTSVPAELPWVRAFQLPELRVISATAGNDNGWPWRPPARWVVQLCSR